MNTKALNVHHNFGGDFKFVRNKKDDTREQIKGSMHGKNERGLDYTPLFRFLLSKVGKDWDTVFSEAKARLDKTEPIFWIVALHENEKQEIVRMGESSFYSGMFVNEARILQLTNPKLTPKDLKHYCTCCTHSFNSKVY